jgi:hypothetical protein
MLVYIIEVIAYRHFAHFQLCSATTVTNRLQSCCASSIFDTRGNLKSIDSLIFIVYHTFFSIQKRVPL